MTALRRVADRLRALTRDLRRFRANARNIRTATADAALAHLDAAEWAARVIVLRIENQQLRDRHQFIQDRLNDVLAELHHCHRTTLPTLAAFRDFDLDTDGVA